MTNKNYSVYEQRKYWLKRRTDASKDMHINNLQIKKINEKLIEIEDEYNECNFQIEELDRKINQVERNVVLNEKERAVWELKKQGLDNKDIAEQTGISYSLVCKISSQIPR